MLLIDILRITVGEKLGRVGLAADASNGPLYNGSSGIVKLAGNLGKRIIYAGAW